MGLKSAGKRLSSLQPLEAPLRNNIRTPTWTRTDASRFAPNANNIRSREDGCFDSDASGGGLGDFSSDSDSPFNSGKWTVEENKAAKAAVETLAERVECPHLKGRGKEWTVDWQKVSEAVGTRSRVQCRSKLEKPFQKAKNNAVHAVAGKKTPKPWVPKPTGTTKPDGRIAKGFKSATCSCGACDNRYYGSTSWKSVAGLACKSCEQAQHPANHGWCGACRDPTRPHGSGPCATKRSLLDAEVKAHYSSRASAFEIEFDSTLYSHFTSHANSLLIDACIEGIRAQAHRCGTYPGHCRAVEVPEVWAVQSNIEGIVNGQIHAINKFGRGVQTVRYTVKKEFCRLFECVVGKSHSTQRHRISMCDKHLKKQRVNHQIDS